MPSFFPRTTVEWRLEEPRAFRRLSLSLVEMALLTGAGLRLYRVLAMAYASQHWAAFAGALALGVVVLVAMLTAHLANYPTRQWAWRAPAFAALEAVGEMLVSLALIALGHEPDGSARAGFADWLPMAARVLLTRGLILCAWAVLLAGILHVVRRTLPDVPDEEEELARSGA